MYISEQTITFGKQYDPAIFATLSGNFAIIQDSYEIKTVKVSQPFLIANSMIKLRRTADRAPTGMLLESP